MDGRLDLPGYEILEKVGEGSMATVWMARQLSLDRVVAIKLLSPHLLRDEEAIQRFQFEAQAAAKLNHPGIVQIYDAGLSGGAAYLVMEFVAGCAVSDLLERKRNLDEKHALLIAEGVALALAYAWKEARLIHCDVKPPNVLIDEDGLVKITDLGLAKVFGKNRPDSNRELIEGTPHYVSPEQARGESDLDCRSDIYSLGAMLYHLTTGCLPFGDNAELDVVKRQISDYLPDPQQLNADLSEDAAWLIEKMMVKDRSMRYQSWPEVLTDLEAVGRGDPPAARALAAGYSTVLRSEIRSLASLKPSSKPLREEALKKDQETPPTLLKQRIILPKGLRQKVDVARKHHGELARAVFTLFLMAAAVFVAYGTLFLVHYRKAQTGRRGEGKPPLENQAIPPRSYVIKKERSPASASDPPEKTSESDSAPAVSAAGDQASPWKNPTFLRGATLFNDALASYHAYLADRKNPDLLKPVEQQCRDAIAAFESCRSFAPPEIKIQDLIDQAYHLISDCRQITLMDSVKPAPIALETKSSPAMAAPLPLKEQPMNPLILAPTWNNSQSGGEEIVQDLRELLSSQGQPAIELKADSTLILFGQVRYLMPLKEAVKMLGKPISPRKSLSCPGFPKDSFFYYAMEGAFGNGFDKLLLIADSADHIAAVELVNKRPDKSLWLDPSLFSEKRRVYDFAQTRTKENAKWSVGHRVETVGRIVRIDSELAANDEFGYLGLGDSKERVSLHLPQPLVNLILLRLENMRGL